MPATAIVCPACAATLKTAAPLPAGKKVKCPKCAGAFAVSGRAGNAPAAAVRQVHCPKCRAPLRTAKPLPPGRPVKCPKCAGVFRVAGPTPPRATMLAQTSGRETKLAAPPRPDSPRPVRVKCPKCAAILQTSSALVPGRAVKCPHCTGVFRVPSATPKATKLAGSGTPKPTQLAPKPLPKPTKLVGASGPKQTRLAPPQQPPARKTTLEGPVRQLVCPGCKTVLKLAGKIPEGKPIQCPRCAAALNVRRKKDRRPDAARPAKPTPPARPATTKAARTILAAPPPPPAQQPAPRTKPRKTMLAAEPPPPPRRQKLRYFLLTMIGVVTVGLCYVAYVIFDRYTHAEIPASAWQEFAPPAGGCQVVMPGSPRDRQAVAHAPGFGDAKKFSVVRDRDDVAFLLSYSERPSRASPRREFAELYAAERDHVLSSVKGRMTHESDRPVNKHAGKEFQVELDTGGMLIGRVILVQGTSSDRLYVLVVAGASVRAGEYPAMKYLDSFEIP
ncbi:MAG: hypothetical protein K2R98_16745 [Gemmataceae bacterium]|nr:hypothetical protein [Gemmataceae bacterium]